LAKLGPVTKLIQAANPARLLQVMTNNPLLAAALKWVSANAGASVANLPSGTIGIMFPLYGSRYKAFCLSLRLS